jgi:hypothetical protein
MFKKAIIVAVASLIVGCSANGVKAPVNVDVKASVNGLQNFNVAENKSLTVSGKELQFITFYKKTETVVVENGKKFKDTLEDFGSGVQWNEDYVVTAKHVNFADNSAYKCREGCDIQFVKRKATVAAPVWRDVVALEQITFVGVDQTNTLQAKTGSDIDMQTTTSSNHSVKVHVVSVPTVGGMSGGPAYAKDGSVVGVLTGSVTLGKNPTEMGVFVPYETIKSEWDKFQAQQAQVAMK